MHHHRSVASQLRMPPLTYPCHEVRQLNSVSPVWRHVHATRHATQVHGPLARDTSLAQLEAYLFASDEPLPLRRLVAMLKPLRHDEVKRMVKRLAHLYDAEPSSLQLVELAGGYQLRTRDRYHPWLLKLQSPGGLHLSAAARETLTMIAYRQPINRADLEALRGVSCIDVLRVLLEKGVIRIVGRDKTLGRPVQYGTTRLFLEWMGLRSLDELPVLRE
ncbi:MAG: SMC-Scp complex subunit ScpB [Gemmatales bacterium]